MNGKAVVFLSSGEMFTSDDRELQFVAKRFAIINGKKFTFPPPSLPKEQANPQRDPTTTFNF